MPKTGSSGKRKLVLQCVKPNSNDRFGLNDESHVTFQFRQKVLFAKFFHFSHGSFIILLYICKSNDITDYGNKTDI